MNNTTRFIFVLPMFLLFASTFANAEEEDPLLWRNIGDWAIRLDTTLENSCYVVTIYEGNTLIRLGFNRPNQNMYLMIGDDDWQSLEEGKEYAIKIRFGDEEPWTGDATAISFSNLPTLVLSISTTESIAVFLEEFMRETSVQVEYKNKSIAHLSLKGSFKAGRALMECQEAINKIQDDGVQDEADPFTSPARDHNDPFAI